ncbi:Guanine nucleotide-binding protein subunit gamma-1 [Nymphon striatum]|nr:Guanine nucleotide-binding protein subunit gamma-1 [Nymphon striatum]
MSGLHQQRKTVEQLRREASVQRINVSVAIIALKKYCDEHENEDYLLVGFNPQKANPFREKSSCTDPQTRFCCVISWCSNCRLCSRKVQSESLSDQLSIQEACAKEDSSSSLPTYPNFLGLASRNKGIFLFGLTTVHKIVLCKYVCLYLDLNFSWKSVATSVQQNRKGRSLELQKRF